MGIQRFGESLRLPWNLVCSLKGMLGRRNQTGDGSIDLRFDVPSEARQRSFFYWLAVLLVLASFIILLVVPFVINRNVKRYQTDIGKISDPAHGIVDRLNIDLAIQGYSARDFLLTGSQAALDRYRAAGVDRRRALVELQPYTERMGSAAVRSLILLQEALERWQQATDLRIGGNRGVKEAETAETETLFQDAFKASGELSEEIGRFQKSRQNRVARAQRFDSITTFWLAALGILSTLAVVWLALRLSRIALQLERRAREEMAFRKVASALSGAIEIDEVLEEVTLSAAAVTRADGAYVEKITEDGGVEVLAASGKGTPPRGLLVRFPGSLTEEIIRSGRPVILTEMSGFGQAMAPYLMEVCPACELMVIPLVAENEPLGALVLLNSATSGRHFRGEDSDRAKTLGDLISLALRRVATIARERDARRDAQEALRSRDEVLAIVSHDLRNPLTAILLTAGLLNETAAEDDREAIEGIRANAQRMQRLIQDLLEVARMEGAPLTLKLDSIPASRIVSEACDATRPLAVEKRITLECLAPSSLPQVCGDHDRLLQLFGNLIGNAVKFTPEGGRITVAGEDHGAEVEFSVADSGPGIPERELPHVFERFWQAKKTAHLGAGLGLSIAKGIAESHGGRISVANVPTGGAVFRFSVPAAGPASVKKPANFCGGAQRAPDTLAEKPRGIRRALRVPTASRKKNGGRFMRTAVVFHSWSPHVLARRISSSMMNGFCTM